jgi:hypothetical protein
MAKDLGSIQEGKLADLIVLDKDPLENIRNTNTIRFVMKNGELFDAETLDQVWPQQKKLPRQYWWDLEPTLRKTAPTRPSSQTAQGSADQVIRGATRGGDSQLVVQSRADRGRRRVGGLPLLPMIRYGSTITTGSHRWRPHGADR